MVRGSHECLTAVARWLRLGRAMTSRSKVKSSPAVSDKLGACAAAMNREGGARDAVPISHGFCRAGS